MERQNLITIIIIALAILTLIVVIVKLIYNLHKRSLQKKYLISKIEEAKAILDKNNIVEAEKIINRIRHHDISFIYKEEINHIDSQIAEAKQQLINKLQAKIEEVSPSPNRGDIDDINELLNVLNGNHINTFQYRKTVSKLTTKVGFKENLIAGFGKIKGLLKKGDISEAEDTHLELSIFVDALDNDDIRKEYDKVQNEIINSTQNPIIKYLIKNRIAYLYHFTDLRNLNSIKAKGGLYSWYSCNMKGIDIPSPGGDATSYALDKRYNLQDYVRLSFCDDHPMAYNKWIRDGQNTRIVLLKIDLRIILLKGTLFSDMNASDSKHHLGCTFQDLRRINLNATQEPYVSRYILKTDDSGTTRKELNPIFKYHQAEVLIRKFVPLEYIRNIDSPDIIFTPISETPMPDSF